MRELWWNCKQIWGIENFLVRPPQRAHTHTRAHMQAQLTKIIHTHTFAHLSVSQTGFDAEADQPHTAQCKHSQSWSVWQQQQQQQLRQLQQKLDNNERGATRAEREREREDRETMRARKAVLIMRNERFEGALALARRSLFSMRKSIVSVGCRNARACQSNRGEPALYCLRISVYVSVCVRRQ